MIVGFLINTCEPFYRGGYERRAWSFARELARQGHDVSIFTSCPCDQTIDGVRFVRLAAPRQYFNARGVRNGWADLVFALAVLKLFWKSGEKRLDVLDICATPFVHLPVAAFVARLKGIPAFLTCHEALLGSLSQYVRERGHGPGFKGWLLEKLLAALYSSGMRSISRRIAVSHRTAQGMTKEKFPAEITIEFGLEREAFSAQAPTATATASPVRFVYCGRLTPIKAVNQALAALLSLRGEGVPFHFDIIGEGSEAAELRSMVEAADCGHLITFHGAVSEQVKRALLAECEVFILSSPREGFSIATLEAMARGCCAVIVSDPRYENGALDFVRPDVEGLTVDSGPDALREALRLLLRDPALRLRLRQGSWNSAYQYQIEAQTNRLLEYYARKTKDLLPRP